MKNQIIKYIVTGLLVFTFLRCSNTSQDRLTMECNEAGIVTQFEEEISDMKWKPSSYPLYDLGGKEGLVPALVVEMAPEHLVRLKLTVTNTANAPMLVEPRFPALDSWTISGTNPESVYQLFPRQGEMANNADSISYEEVYSGNFPFQFMDIYKEGKGGIMIQTLDTANYPKKYYLQRNKRTFSLGVIHRAKMLAPGESWVLPIVVLKAHPGDWHAALFSYRDWLKENIKPLTSRKDWFRDVYNFRQTFLYDNGGEKGAYDPKSKKVDLIAKVDESVEAFGGVDYLHLFDWGQTAGQGRCGDYDPWNYLDKKELQMQVRQVKDREIPVGLYHEGYLLSPNSTVCKKHGADWQMLNARSGRYDRFGDGYYYPCPLVEEWREYIANTVKRSSEELAANGVYIDQYGFGWQYGCYNPAHGHDVYHTSVNSEMQVYAEAELMNHIKGNVSPDVVTYTEECPTDISTRYQDGSFTYAICAGRDSARHNPSVVNLARFAFPDYKLIEILHIDDPIGHDTVGIKHVFFNGEGLWLSGPLSNPDWFPEDVRRTIRKCYTILKTYKEAFRSLDPEPLVETKHASIYANYFPGKKEHIWTLYNASNQPYEGEVLEIEVIKGATYYDVWNGQILAPEKKGDKLIIMLSMESKDVGCIVQILP